MKKYALIIYIHFTPLIILTMNEEVHQIIVYNHLRQSSVIISSPHCAAPDNKETSDYYYNTKLKPQHQKTFYIRPFNQQSHLQILLPSCYTKQSCDINSDNNGMIQISSSSRDQFTQCLNEVMVTIYQDKKCIFETTTFQDTNLKSLNPAQYYLSKKLLLNELKHQKNHHNHITIDNSSDENFELQYMKEQTYNQSEENSLFSSIILPYTTQTFSIWPTIQNLGKLFLYIPSCKKIITLKLNPDQHLITIKKNLHQNITLHDSKEQIFELELNTKKPILQKFPL